MIGTSVLVADKLPFGEQKGVILLPQQSVTFHFGRFGPEPMSWTFDVSTKADAFVVGYTIESTWVEGMPVNPCY